MRLAAAFMLVAVLATTAHADEPCTSITIEPISLLVTTTASLGVERKVTPQIGVAVLAGGGRSTSVAIGDHVHTYSVGQTMDSARDIRFGRIHLGGQASYYAEQFRGGHATVEAVYVHYGWANPNRDSIDTVSGSVYAGWKWLLQHDITIVVQAGIGLVMTHGEDETESGLVMDRDGTLGPIHLAANGAVGWSF
jgi:hypothetical protein